jgi:hypothetical protein
MDDGDWRPTQVFTRRWLRFADGSEGWSYTLFDGDWCRRDQTLHLYNTGGGQPYVGRAAKPGIHWRIWLTDGESVSDGGVTHERPDGEPMAWRRPGLSPTELHECGFEITTDYPSDIFEYASDERTYYCETCDNSEGPDIADAQVRINLRLPAGDDARLLREMEEAELRLEKPFGLLMLAEEDLVSAVVAQAVAAISGDPGRSWEDMVFSDGTMINDPGQTVVTVHKISTHPGGLFGTEHTFDMTVRFPRAARYLPAPPTAVASSRR